jgi:mono/diheme cytochrome c family protein
MNVRPAALAGTAVVGAVLVGVFATHTAAVAAQGGQAPPTFSKDVAPIFYENCVSCHRPGEMAPMSLLTYESARPYARSIRTRVENGTMPPWHAEAPEGTFHNERKLTPQERDTIVRWASNGAPQGNPADLPTAPKFPDGWTIGTPDVVLTMAKEFEVPATGTVEYQNFRVPTNFTEDEWVQAIELRPSAPQVVHHILVFAIMPGLERQDPFRQLPLPNGGNHGVELPRRAAAPAGAGAEAGARPGGAPAEGGRPAGQSQASQEGRPVTGQPAPQRQQQQPVLVASLAPGMNTLRFQPDQALLIKAGTVLTFQVHYTANGTAAKDKSSLAFIFAKQAPRQEVRSTHVMNPQLFLPAGAGNQRVDSLIEFTQDSHIVAMVPHTHLRGKSWEYRLQHPDGREEVVLSVPKYDFNWQTYYEFVKPVAAPKGSKLLAIAHYDNSAANKANPDPTLDVRWGEQTWEEMQYTGLSYTIDQPETVASR